MKRRQLSAEDVSVGMDLPPISLCFTYHKIAMTPFSTWDFFPGHSEPEYAAGQGQKSIYLNTLTLQGFSDRIVTEWAGPATFIARRRMAMKNSVYVGDTLTASGRVDRIDLENDRSNIVLSIRLRTEAASVCDVETTIILPQRLISPESGRAVSR